MGLLKRLKESFGFIEYKINEHYTPAVDYQKDYYLPITILRGPYNGTTFSFENVKWNRVIDKGERMVATYDLVPINPAPINFKGSKKFRAAADDIWVDYASFIMDNHNKLKETVLKDNVQEYPDEEYRTDDIEEFVGQRSIRQKSDGVPSARVRAKQKRTSTIGRDKGLHSKVQPTSIKDGD